MNISKIRNELTEDFGLKLEVSEVRLPNRDEIITRPKDFEEGKGFVIISQVKWLTLNTFLQFESFSGDILRLIENNHKGKIRILVDNLNRILKKPNINLIIRVDNQKISEVYESVNIAKLSLSVENPTMNLDLMGIEDYVISQHTLLLGLILLLFDLIETGNDESGVTVGMPEGSKTVVEVNRYERSRINRQACINYYGYSCKICNFNFEEKYGEIGRNYIQVHHITPVSELIDNYIVNPIKDLIPVCPNCHAMLHRKNYTLDIHELREIIHAHNS